MKFTDFLGTLFGWIAKFCFADLEFTAYEVMNAISGYFLGSK